MEMVKPEETQEEVTKPSELIYGFVALLVILGLPAFWIWNLTPDSIKYPLLYGTIYKVNVSHVHIDKEPTDCDWGHAPIGDKDCHYKKHVYPGRNNEGRVTDVYVVWDKLRD
jgi:hypothetical protein